MDGVNDNLEYPYLFSGNYNGEGTVDILVDLITKSNNL
jgi:hypothetical protein